METEYCENNKHQSNRSWNINEPVTNVNEVIVFFPSFCFRESSIKRNNTDIRENAAAAGR